MENIFFPYEFRNLTSEELMEVDKPFSGTMNEFIRVGPKGYIMPKEFKMLAAGVYNMTVRPRDVFVVTYQRSGTTMMQELVWLLVNDFDYETAKSRLLTQRYSFLEMSMCLNDTGKKILQQISDNKAKEMLETFNKMPIDILAETPGPRFIKTHIPLSFLPPNTLDIAKIVYVARDPRDVVVSSYHHSKLFVQNGQQGEFKQFWDIFRKGLFILTPYFEHVKESWAQRNHRNMMFIFYEDLQKDLSANIRSIAKFLGKEPTVEQITGLCNHLNIDNFKNNKSVNIEEMRSLGLLAENEHFIRKGKAGGWRDYFDDEMTKQAERWIVENLRDTDLRFPSMQHIVI